MNSLLLATYFLLTNWVNISGEIHSNNFKWKAADAKVILTSNEIQLEESPINERGQYSIDYLEEGETGFELILVYNSLKDTVLLKEVEQFESQFEVWNFSF